MTTDLTQRLATRAAAAPAGRGMTIADYLERHKAQIALALPQHVSPDRFARIILTELRRNKKLAACDPMSLLGALMQSAQLGLEPGPLGHAYLVPFGTEVTFIIGYRGLIDLMRRSGEVSGIVARDVRHGDDFAYWIDENGDHLEHRPNLGASRGEVYVYYAVARFRDGGSLVHVMAKDDIERHRKRSRAADSGPWRTDYDAMARKTVIRAMAPYLPTSIEVAEALEADERAYEWHGAQAVPIEVEGAGTALPTDDAVPLESVLPEASSASPDALPAPSPYDAFSRDDLVERARALELATSGTKADLAARIIAWEDEHEPDHSPPDPTLLEEPPADDDPERPF